MLLVIRPSQPTMSAFTEPKSIKDVKGMPRLRTVSFRETERITTGTRCRGIQRSLIRHGISIWAEFTRFGPFESKRTVVARSNFRTSTSLFSICCKRCVWVDIAATDGIDIFPPKGTDCDSLSRYTTEFKSDVRYRFERHFCCSDHTN